MLGTLRRVISPGLRAGSLFILDFLLSPGAGLGAAGVPQAAPGAVSLADALPPVPFALDVAEVPLAP